MDFPGNFAEHIDPSKIHILNLSFLVNTLKKQQGGTAGNIAYNLSLLKVPVAILGTAGEDFTPYGNFLKKSGVSTDHIKIIKGESTSQAFIVTDQKDNQITAFYPGAMASLTGLNLVRLKPRFVVIAPNQPETMMALVSECQKLKIPYLFDPGMQLPRLSDKDLSLGIKGAKILIGNDYEMGLINKRVRSISNEIIITTLGEKGSIIKTKDQTINIPPGKPKKVVDPTGAGDAYRAGFLAGYFKGLDLKICGQMGAIAACYTVEKYGTTTHIFSLSEYAKRYQKNFKNELPY